MNTVERLERGLKRILNSGWNKGAYRDRRSNHTTYCAVGALLDNGQHGLFGADQSTRDAAESLKQVFGGYSIADVIVFNDAKNRRRAEVVNLYRKAIALAKEESHAHS
jgi:hypothetical protein